MKHLFMTVSTAALIAASFPAMACTYEDCGTVVATGFGGNCAWVVLQSTVFPNKKNAYGVPLGNGDDSLLLSTAIKGGPYTVHVGSVFNCKGAKIPIVIYGSNDPSEQ